MAHQTKSTYKEDFGGHNSGAMSAREQLRGLEKAEPPDSADDLDRPKGRKRKKRDSSGKSLVSSLVAQYGEKR